MKACLRLALCCLLAGLSGTDALAQDAAPPASQGEARPDLYIEAMQAISDGRKDDASKALARMIAKGPRHAGEWLDLAMIQCALGHPEDAERLFTAIEERFDPPQGIREMIAQQRAQGCARWKPASQLSIFAGRGYDRNVNQGASNPSYTLGGSGGATLELLPEFLPRHDQYTVLSGDYMRELSDSGTLGFVQALVRRNDHLASYNTASLFGGVEQPWQFGNWRLRGTAFGGVLTLGGHLYQEQAQLQLRITPPLPLPAGLEWYGMAGLSHVNYKTLTNFNSNTSELRGVLSYRGKQSYAQASLGFLSDHAVGVRPGGDRDGWSLGLSGRHRFNAGYQAEFDLSRQTWRGQTAYSAPLIAERRHQDTRVARVTLIHPITENQSVHLEARRVQNKENISIFQYNNSVLQLSWHWTGF